MLLKFYSFPKKSPIVQDIEYAYGQLIVLMNALQADLYTLDKVVKGVDDFIVNVPVNSPVMQRLKSRHAIESERLRKDTMKKYTIAVSSMLEFIVRELSAINTIAKVKVDEIERLKTNGVIFDSQFDYIFAVRDCSKFQNEAIKLILTYGKLDRAIIERNVALNTATYVAGYLSDLEKTFVEAARHNVDLILPDLETSIVLLRNIDAISGTIGKVVDRIVKGNKLITDKLAKIMELQKKYRTINLIDKLYFQLYHQGDSIAFLREWRDSLRLATDKLKKNVEDEQEIIKQNKETPKGAISRILVYGSPNAVALSAESDVVAKELQYQELKLAENIRGISQGDLVSLFGDLAIAPSPITGGSCHKTKTAKSPFKVHEHATIMKKIEEMRNKLARIKIK